MFPEGRIVDFLIVGVVALIVVGPKDLPVLMRRVGEFVAKMRAIQSELDELRREVEAMRSGASLPTAVGLGDDAETKGVFDDIHASLRGVDAEPHPPKNYEYPASFEPAAGETAPEAAPNAEPAAPGTPS